MPLLAPVTSAFWPSRTRRSSVIVQSSSRKPGKKAHDAPRKLAEDLRLVELDRDGLADFSQRRVRRDHLRELRELELRADRKSPRVRELARVRAENRNAEHAPVAARDELDRAGSLALGLRPVVGLHLDAQDLDVVAMRLARIVLACADLRQLRIGVGDPRQRPVAGL